MKVHLYGTFRNYSDYSKCGLRIWNIRYGEVRPFTFQIDEVTCENCKRVHRANQESTDVEYGND